MFWTRGSWWAALIVLIAMCLVAIGAAQKDSLSCLELVPSPYTSDDTTPRTLCVEHK